MIAWPHKPPRATTGHDPRCRCMACRQRDCLHRGGAYEYADGRLVCELCLGTIERGTEPPDEAA